MKSVNALVIFLLAACVPFIAVAQSSSGLPIPAHMVAYFPNASKGCPAGWSEAQYAAGRLILATSTPKYVGTQQGTPVPDLQSPTHTHAFNGTVSVGSVGTATTLGSNKGVGHASKYAATGTVAVDDPGFPLLQLLTCEFTGASSGDSLPSGTVAFFNLPQGASASSTCPTNWQTINGIDGRFILPSPSSTPPPAPGALGGAAPWTNYQAPTHTHTLSASANVASTDFLPGRGLNHDLAKPGAQPVTGTLAANTSPIVPFVVLLACEKALLPLSGAPTPGMAVYLGSPQCLDGWAYTPTAPGRFIVSIGDAGTYGWPNGVTSYTSVGGASSTHTHAVSGSAAVSNHDTDLAHGSGLHLGKSGEVTFSGPSTSATLALPFVTFNLCTYTGQT